MSSTNFLRGHARPILAAGLFLGCAAASATDTYDAASKRLTIPALAIGNASYSNVVVTAGTVLGVFGGTPNGHMDSYDPAGNVLTIPAVRVGGTTYANVSATVAGLVSIGSAAWIDSFSPSTGQLRLAAVSVGPTLYNNVVVSAGTGNIVSVGTGLPYLVQDQFNPATGQLTVAAVQVGSTIYTNVVLNITLKNVLSVGAASTLDDAPVQGLCYSTSPSATATASPTSLAGQFLYNAGDDVTLWIDGSGAGCTGTSPGSATSVPLGSFAPTGSHTSILALPGGLQAAETLTALNVGSAAIMNVSGLDLYGPDIANLGVFVRQHGATLPSAANGSIDTFFDTVQADTLMAADSSVPPFVTAVAANPSRLTSVLANTVSGNLLATAAGLPGQPTGIPIPANGELRFSLSVFKYTCPACSSPSTVYTSAAASFLRYDGHGNVTQFGSPGALNINASNLADQTGTGTYQVTGNVMTRTENVVNALNGYAGVYTETYAANYRDAVTTVGSGTFSKTYTAGPQSGKVFLSGSTTFDAILLMPVTLSMVAGHTVTTTEDGCPGNVNVLSFAGVGSPLTSVTMSQSCGDLAVTLTPSTIPGILEGTDSSGYIVYIGVYGSGLVPGARIVGIQEAQGSLGTAGNGSLRQWNIGKPIVSVN